jgi:hypothetical protein
VPFLTNRFLTSPEEVERAVPASLPNTLSAACAPVSGDVAPSESPAAYVEDAAGSACGVTMQLDIRFCRGGLFGGWRLKQRSGSSARKMVWLRRKHLGRFARSQFGRVSFRHFNHSTGSLDIKRVLWEPFSAKNTLARLVRPYKWCSIAWIRTGWGTCAPPGDH